MDLYLHQRVGADWLAARKHAILADEQGLGKTATALCAADRAGAARALVLCPTAVAHNWLREARTWSPTRCGQLLLTGKAKLDPVATLVVTTHGLLTRQPMRSQLSSARWDALIVDESHAFKNERAMRTRALFGSAIARAAGKGLIEAAQRVWLLTGTPMPNDPTELWPALRALAPERIMAASPSGWRRPASWLQFRRQFCALQPNPWAPDGFKIVGARNTVDLRTRLTGFMLRRRKKDHLDLPPLRWGTTELTVTTLPAELRAMEDRAAQALAEGRSVEQVLAGLRDENALPTWRRLCGEAKVDAAVELLGGELDEGALTSVVVFAHHREVVRRLAAGLAKHGAVTITGDTAPAARQRAVDTFQAGEARVCVAQLQAGGVGITLTAAQDVVFVESDWVPGTMRQAADRCHRIGQEGSVLARVLALAGSIDGMIAATVARKAAMIDEVIEKLG
jgi:SWI/SNF-related matrix-associated actin-dependent regulator 1 of chromatin subfamily A